VGCVHGFNNCIFGEESGQERGARKGEASNSKAGGCKGGKVVYAAYFADVLLVV